MGEKWCNLDDLVKRDNWCVPGASVANFICAIPPRLYILLKKKGMIESSQSREIRS